MIFLISGSSHTGKTLLAQKLLEKYKYPYISIDHLKMGLIRSGKTELTPEDDDKLTEYLWPIVCAMIKIAIENKQNLIVEGCYIPFDFKKDFSKEYLPFIKDICLIFSENYIENNYDNIINKGSVIEKRLDYNYPKELMIEDNKKVLKGSLKYKNDYVLIDKDYEVDVCMDTVLTSERLIFKRINKNDFKNISEMLKDPEVMYAWEKGFTSEEVELWIDKRLKGYEEFGYDYFLAIDKSTKKVVGQIGLLDEVISGEHFTGLGYILKKEFWHKGYALEGAKAMIDFAFSVLGKEKVIATIRPENEASLKVAKKLKMNLESEFIKVYKGKEMKHLVYSILK